MGFTTHHSSSLLYITTSLHLFTTHHYCSSRLFYIPHIITTHLVSSIYTTSLLLISSPLYTPHHYYSSRLLYIHHIITYSTLLTLHYLLYITYSTLLTLHYLLLYSTALRAPGPCVAPSRGSC